VVKCADCGLLALRSLDTFGLRETSLEYRRGLSHPIAEPHSRFVPLCTALQWESPSPDGDYQAAHELLDEERRCDDFFIEWVPGFAPKEHREMLDRQWMLARDDRLTEETRKREDARDAAQRQWQKEQEAAADRRHDEQESGEQGRHRQELLVFGGVIAIATIVAALIEVFFGGGVTFEFR
jgi:hypothetical protein